MATDEPRLNVLISSKQNEFTEERGDIRALMAPMPLLVADAAEDWGAQSGSIRETFLRQAKGCALYVGLFGCVYSAPTIEEYRAAAENPHREILVYVKECPARDDDLNKFLDEVKDPEFGRSIVTYESWATVKPNFQRHLWAAIQRMIAHCLELGNKPVSLSGSDGPLERRRRRYEQSLAEMGLPVDADRAYGLAAQLRRFFPQII
jgi:hypothetical protein